MAKKKHEVQLQFEINTQNEWNEILKKEGLLVVDVYQEWCGPCKAMISFFKRLKNDIGDDLLSFFIAKADFIDSLEKYRRKSEPCFLLYGGGMLTAVIRGANPPAIEEAIKLKLEQEHKIMKGEMERLEIRDPMFDESEIEKVLINTLLDMEEINREVTLALIKPDAVRNGKVDEIMNALKNAEFEILAQAEIILTIEKAEEFYCNMEDSENFQDVIKFITSGPCCALVLAKRDKGVISELLELIGPKMFDEAKERSPQSLRAIYGTNSVENALHGSNSKEDVQRELTLFFPHFVIPKISLEKPESSRVKRTLALIRPSAYEFKDNIMEKIVNAGFCISMQKEIQFTKNDAQLFYRNCQDQSIFDELTTEMSKGVIVALALEKENAVSAWRSMLGPVDPIEAKETYPNSFRALFSKENIEINLIHGSESDDAAEHELKQFFPMEQTIMIIKPDGMKNCEEIIAKVKESGFNIAKTKQIVLKKDLVEKIYENEKYNAHYNDLIVHMESGPSLVLVLSRQDAIAGLSSIMGPEDPLVAAEAYPDSLRGIYGQTTIENAVYGTGSLSDVNDMIMLIFEKLEFDNNGFLLPQYIENTTENDATDKEIEAADNHGETDVNEEQRIISKDEEEVNTGNEDALENQGTKDVQVTEENVANDIKVTGASEENIVKKGEDLYKIEEISQEEARTTEEKEDRHENDENAFEEKSEIENVDVISEKANDDDDIKKRGEAEKIVEDIPKDEGKEQEIIMTESRRIDENFETTVVTESKTDEDCKIVEKSETEEESGEIYENRESKIITEATIENNMEKIGETEENTVKAKDGTEGLEESGEKKLTMEVKLEKIEDVSEKSDGNNEQIFSFDINVVRSGNRSKIVRFPESATGEKLEGTMRAYPNFNAEADCKVLNKAMKGLGTDEQAIIDCLGGRNLEQRLIIKQTYKTMFGKDLLDHLKSELSGHFCQAVIESLHDPISYDCLSLHNAMKGAGTRENVLIEVLTSRSNEEIESIKAQYQKMYNKNLEEEVISETSGYFKRVLVSCLQANKSEISEEDVEHIKQYGVGVVVSSKLAAKEAQELYEAGEKKLGTDEATFIRIFCTRNKFQLQKTAEQYLKLTGKDIIESIHNEMSGDLASSLKAIVMQARNTEEYFATRLYKSMKGVGTNDSDLIRIILSRSEIDLKNIKKEFQKLYKETLEKWIEGDTSGDYKKYLIKFVHGN